jgi:hypothetical protein
MVEYKKVVKENAGYILIVALLLLYVLTKLNVVALLCAISIAGLFIFETFEGAKQRGWRKEVEEILVAVIVGVAIWYGGGFLLNTPAPLDGVTSCSMLPRIERGDMVVLRGTQINAPGVEVTSSEWEQIKQKLHTNFTCGPCGNEEGYTPYNFSLCRISCMNSCLIAIDDKPVFSDSNDSLFSYNYEMCKLKNASGDILNSVCLKSVTVKGRTFEENYSNDVVVYEPEQNSVFYGSIIHRAFLKVSVEGKEYYLIKGDNNEILDVQVPAYKALNGNQCTFYADQKKENQPVPLEKIKGKVILRIPYLGYFKLFLWGYLEIPPGCDTVIG